MKKQLLTAALVAGTFLAQGQTVVQDSVLMGAGYANQVWYSLENDEQGSAPKNNWDIAFDVVEITSCLHINTPGGVKLWGYPKGDKTAWATVDTTGLSTWPERYNSDTSWARGAMGNYADPSNPFDLDWGTYDISTHVLNGDSLYIIKLTTGDYKKLFIEKLTSGTFYFKFADLNGSNEVNEQVNKSQFTGKNLGYYSISAQAVANREPDRSKWDLVFTQYTAYVPTAYTVTGILQNRGVHAVKVAGLADPTTYNNWQTETFNSAINTIGYNWKTYNMGTSSYDIADSTAYFVAVPKGTAGDDIWKLILTGFAGADGKSVFSKQKLQTASITDLKGNVTSMALYPNPSNGGNVQVVYNINSSNETVMLTVTDMTGRTVMAQQLSNTTGLHTYTLPANTFSSGMYIVAVSSVGGRVQQQLVIN